MGGLFCPHCGETLPETGVHCPTCTADVGWWLITGEQAQGPLALRELRDAWQRGVFDNVEWIRLGAGGAGQFPESVAQVLRGADYPRWSLIEDWTDFRNLFRLFLVVVLPLVALAALLVYWLNHWPAR